MNNPQKSNQNGRHRSPKKILRWLILAVGLGLSATIGGIAAVIGAYYYVSPALPAAETIRDIPLQIPLRIFSRDGYLVSEIGERRRVLVTFDEVPAHVVNAFVAAEDQRFWVHPLCFSSFPRAISRAAAAPSRSSWREATFCRSIRPSSASSRRPPSPYA